MLVNRLSFPFRRGGFCIRVFFARKNSFLSFPVTFTGGGGSFWLLTESSAACVPLQSGVEGGLGLHGSISLSSLLLLPRLAGELSKSTAMSLQSLSGCCDG